MPNLSEVLAVLEPFADVFRAGWGSALPDDFRMVLCRPDISSRSGANLTVGQFRAARDLYARLSASPAAQDSAEVAGQSFHTKADIAALRDLVNDAKRRGYSNWHMSLEMALTAIEMSLEVAALTPKEGGQARVPDGWRDIASAPRDGTYVVLYAPTRRESYQCGRWIWESDNNSDPADGVWWMGDGREQDQPSLWQPLPTPPDVQKGETP